MKEKIRAISKLAKIYESKIISKYGGNFEDILDEALDFKRDTLNKEVSRAYFDQGVDNGGLLSKIERLSSELIDKLNDDKFQISPLNDSDCKSRVINGIDKIINKLNSKDYEEKYDGAVFIDELNKYITEECSNILDISGILVGYDNEIRSLQSSLETKLFG